MVSHAKVFQTPAPPHPLPCLTPPPPTTTTHPLPRDCGLQGGKEAKSACIDTVYAVRKMDHTKYFLPCFDWFVSLTLWHTSAFALFVSLTLWHTSAFALFVSLTLWHTSTTVTHCDTHQHLLSLFPSHCDTHQQLWHIVTHISICSLCFPHIVTHINNCDTLWHTSAFALFVSLTLWHTSTTVTHCDTHQQLPCLFPSHRDILNSLLFAFYNLYPRRSPASAKRQLQVNTTSRERNGIRSFLALRRVVSGQLFAGTEIPAATLSPPQWFCIKIGSDESRFNASFIVRGRITIKAVSVNHNFWRGRGAEAGNRTDIVRLPAYAWPLSQTGSVRNVRPPDTADATRSMNTQEAYTRVLFLTAGHVSINLTWRAVDWRLV